MKNISSTLKVFNRALVSIALVNFIRNEWNESDRTNGQRIERTPRKSETSEFQTDFRRVVRENYWQIADAPGLPRYRRYVLRGKGEPTTYDTFLWEKGIKRSIGSGRERVSPAWPPVTAAKFSALGAHTWIMPVFAYIRGIQSPYIDSTPRITFQGTRFDVASKGRLWETSETALSSEEIRSSSRIKIEIRRLWVNDLTEGGGGMWWLS